MISPEILQFILFIFFFLENRHMSWVEIEKDDIRRNNKIFWTHRPYLVDTYIYTDWGLKLKAWGGKRGRRRT